MPKYYCDYCDTFLTHDSPSVRKTHCQGRKHKDNVKYYFQRWMEQEAQTLIDATTAAFKAGKIATNPFAQPPPGAAVPPPGLAPGGMPPGSRPGMPTNFNPMVRIRKILVSLRRNSLSIFFSYLHPSRLEEFLKHPRLVLLHQQASHLI